MLPKNPKGLDGSIKTLETNRRPAGQPEGSGDLLAIGAADRAFPAAVTELGRSVL